MFVKTAALSSNSNYYFPIGQNFGDVNAEYSVSPTPNLIQTAMCDMSIEGVRINFHEDLDNVLYFGLSLSFFSFFYGIYSIIKKLNSPEDMPIGYTDLIVFITFKQSV